MPLPNAPAERPCRTPRVSEIRWTVWAFCFSQPLPSLASQTSLLLFHRFRRAQLLHCRYIISVKRNTIGMLPSVTWEVRHRWSNFEALYLDFYKEMYAVSSYRKVPIPACKHESILGKTFRYGTAHTAPNPANSASSWHGAWLRTGSVPRMLAPSGTDSMASVCIARAVGCLATW